MQNKIHIIILTKNRPDIFKRIILNISQYTIYRITVIDDSNILCLKKNLQILNNYIKSNLYVHYSTKKLFKKFKEKYPSEALKWTEKRYHRDIAPIRNLSIIFSLYDNNDYTIISDDDMYNIDLNLINDKLKSLIKRNKSFVAGFYSIGIPDMTTYERIDYALNNMKNIDKEIYSQYPEKLFEISLEKPASISNETFFTTGLQFCAIKLNKKINNIPAYPPGYNQDCNWARELIRRNIVDNIKVPVTVTHYPDKIRNSTIDDLKFEALGELILELSDRTNFFEEVYSGKQLKSINKVSEILDLPYLENIIKTASEIKDSSILNKFGLKSMIEFFNNDYKIIDWKKEVNIWVKETRIKEKSFKKFLSLYET